MSAGTWRERLADRLTGGELGRLRTAVAARPDHRARVVLGAVLARREVQAAVPARLLEHWQTARWAELQAAESDAARVLRWVEKTWWQPEDPWQGGIDALTHAELPADIPAALAFYAAVITAEHRALASLRRAELREKEEA